jgi:hypothetical protein
VIYEEWIIYGKLSGLFFCCTLFFPEVNLYQLQIIKGKSFLIKQDMAVHRVSSKKLLLIFLLCSIFSFTASAQVITGKVIDAGTGEPLPNANIFLAGTLTGTITNPTGNFELDTKGNVSMPLVISFVGYRTLLLPTDYFNKQSTVQLYEKPERLEEIEVNQIPCSLSRKEMLRRFKKEFLGTSAYASSCKILNEDDIYLFYNDSSQVLHGRANNPLIIINRMLGFRITYLLESFRTSEEGTKYRGYHNFEELEPEKHNLKKSIMKNREKAYIGSVMHFMRSLYHDNIHADDTIFQVRMNLRDEFCTDAGFQILSEKSPLNFYNPSNIDTVLRYFRIPELVIPDDWIHQFHLNDSVRNYVTKRQILVENENLKWLCFRGRLGIIYYPEFMRSSMISMADSIEISPNGYYDPDLIKWNGVIVKKRVGDLLPYDFKL